MRFDALDVKIKNAIQDNIHPIVLEWHIETTNLDSSQIMRLLLTMYIRLILCLFKIPGIPCSRIFP
jgi:hypothetical protein